MPPDPKDDTMITTNVTPAMARYFDADMKTLFKVACKLTQNVQGTNHERDAIALANMYNDLQSLGATEIVKRLRAGDPQ